MTDNPWDGCFSVVAYGANHLKRGDYATAERALAAALFISRAIPNESAAGVRALALYNLSLLRVQQGRAEEARQIREHAASCLAGDTADEAAGAKAPVYQALMADVLMELGEYRRAIPFCEQSIQLVLEWNDPMAMVEVLWRAGKCYARNGLRDHAAVPLRETVKLLRTQAADARLPAVLLDLGNALRKSSPAEAERCYLEAAAWHVARGQLQSAAPAWVNLGVLYSETGRLDEALAHYEKALQVRQQSQGTSRLKMGTLLNNIANCYRRMERFEEAFHSVDRAIGLLDPGGGSSLASAYGTRGLIFRDQKRDEEAVEWFRKSTAEHEKQPSPNPETVAEELTSEMEALRRLGRLDEAKIAEERLESVRARMAGIGAAGPDLSNLKPMSEGAVLIELDFGSSPGKAYGKKDSARLADRLSEAVEEQETGYYSGSVIILESTTLMFYGADGEALFRVVEPVLLGEPMCQGARVTVRQHDTQREVFLPSSVM